MSFTKRLDAILANSKKNLKEDQEHSPTGVHPESGQVVTANFGSKGGQTVDATGPIPTGAAATLKTHVTNASGGPTGHIPVNSDLPRGQQGCGLDKDNKDAGKTPSYTLPEETDEDKNKEDMKEDVPPFLAKKKEGDDKDDKKEVKEETDEKDEKAMKEEAEEKEKKEVAEEAEEDEKADKKAVEEATAALVAGEAISEAFKVKTATIFESTLSNRIKAYRKKLHERMERKLNARVEEIREDLTSKVEGHLDLVVEGWVKENEVGIDSGIRAALVEEFIGGLKTLFEESYIEVPENKIDVLAELTNRINILESKLSEQIETNVDLQKKNRLFERSEILTKASKGLTSTQAQKLKELSEGTDFKTSKQFEQSVNILKESVTGTPNPGKGQKQDLAEQTLTESPNVSNSSKQMSSVVDTLARMAKN
jgi:hypothetical protein